MQQGQANKAAASAAADTAETNSLINSLAADDATKRGSYEADLQRVKTAQAIGTQRTAGAANGGDINSGSNAQLQEDTAAFGELDALTIANNAAREAYGYKVQALTGASNASAISAQGDMAQRNSILGGVIKGAGSYFGGAGFGSSGASAASGASTAYSAGNSASIYSARATA